MADKTMIPLHNLLDKCLGFSIRDLVLETPEDHEKFKQMLRDKIDELDARDAQEAKDKKTEGTL